MAQRAPLRVETGLAIYFCDPFTPWQRKSTVAVFAKQAQPYAQHAFGTLAKFATAAAYAEVQYLVLTELQQAWSIFAAFTLPPTSSLMTSGNWCVMALLSRMQRSIG